MRALLQALPQPKAFESSTDVAMMHNHETKAALPGQAGLRVCDTCSLKYFAMLGSATLSRSK